MARWKRIILASVCGLCLSCAHARSADPSWYSTQCPLSCGTRPGHEFCGRSMGCFPFEGQPGDRPVRISRAELRESTEAIARADAMDAVDAFIAKVWRGWPEAPAGDQHLSPEGRHRAMSSRASERLRADHWFEYTCDTAYAELDLESLIAAMSEANGLSTEERALLAARTRNLCATEGH